MRLPCASRALAFGAVILLPDGSAAQGGGASRPATQEHPADRFARRACLDAGFDPVIEVAGQDESGTRQRLSRRVASPEGRSLEFEAVKIALRNLATRSEAARIEAFSISPPGPMGAAGPFHEWTFDATVDFDAGAGGSDDALADALFAPKPSRYRAGVFDGAFRVLQGFRDRGAAEEVLMRRLDATLAPTDPKDRSVAVMLLLESNTKSALEPSALRLPESVRCVATRSGGPTESPNGAWCTLIVYLIRVDDLDGAAPSLAALADVGPPGVDPRASRARFLASKPSVESRRPARATPREHAADSYLRMMCAFARVDPQIEDVESGGARKSGIARRMATRAEKVPAWNNLRIALYNVATMSSVSRIADVRFTRAKTSPDPDSAQWRMEALVEFDAATEDELRAAMNPATAKGQLRGGVNDGLFRALRALQESGAAKSLSAREVRARWIPPTEKDRGRVEVALVLSAAAKAPLEAAALKLPEAAGVLESRLAAPVEQRDGTWTAEVSYVVRVDDLDGTKRTVDAFAKIAPPG